MGVKALGYVGLKVGDPIGWSQFAVDVFGMMLATDEAGLRRLRFDNYSWRIALEQGDSDDLAYVGFEAAGPPELKAIRKRLDDAGIATSGPDPSVVAARRVTDLFTCQDPDGLQIEICCGPMQNLQIPFVSGTGVSFVTGEQGLGHVVLAAPQIAAQRAFYEGLLGFRLSDTMRLQAGNRDVDVEFYHCNPRHHSLALVPIPSPNRLHHIMFEVASLDHVGVARDRVEQSHGQIVRDIGRHTNDGVISFYARLPGGTIVEFGYGGLTVDDQSWRVLRYEKASIWGHNGPSTLANSLEREG